MWAIAQCPPPVQCHRLSDVISGQKVNGVEVHIGTKLDGLTQILISSLYIPLVYNSSIFSEEQLTN